MSETIFDQNEMDLVYVEWLDHCSMGSGGWTSFDNITSLEPVLFQSVGYLAKETPEYIVIVAHNSQNPGVSSEVSGDLCIIKSCIKDRKKLYTG